jgi:tRNA A-37 threonylcarbamoyl transferase component Bud32
MQRLVCNPFYGYLYRAVKSVFGSFEKIDNVIQNNRNDIRLIEVSERKFVVKAFKGMNYFNRLAYSTIRKSKARRSYEYSLVLLQKGINVPAPIAYLDTYNFGFLCSSIYISEYVSHTLLSEWINDQEKQKWLLPSLIQFINFLHLSNVYHEDLSPANILCEKVQAGFQFTILDLNRVRFKEINFSQGIENLITLSHNQELLQRLARMYAQIRGEDEFLAAELIRRRAFRKTQLINLRRRIKKAIFDLIGNLTSNDHKEKN